MLEDNLQNDYRVLFDKILKQKDRLLEDVIRYSIIGRTMIKEEDKEMSLEKFLFKFKDFIMSLGTHS